MTRAILLWGRRSTVALAWPGLVLLVVLATWSRDGWQTEWDWAVSWGASGTILLGPVIAGLVAHDRAWRHAPTLLLMEQTSPRGRLAALALPAAAAVLGALAWSAGIVPVGVRLVRHGAVAARADVIVPVAVSVTAVVVAAAFVGFAIGSLQRNRAAGPIAALAVYAVFALSPRVELMGLFQAGGSLSTLVGVAVSPAWTLGHVAAHLGLAVGGALLGVAVVGGPSTLRRGTVALAVVPVIAGLVLFHQLKQDGSRVLVEEAMSCTGERPQVCAPARAPDLVDAAAVSLTDAYAQLADSGLPLQGRYVYDRGLRDNRVPDDAGVLSADPGQVTGGRLSRADVLETLVVPRRCLAYAANEPPEDLLAAQAVVADWVGARLDGQVEGPAPAEVVVAYVLLSDCEPDRGPVLVVG
ncbi:hypothetical protein QE364_002309 [Nocardioides zeae]|uniref:Uncharacterized protein n=1 Tax=Nocardioides zeae TaxID=1457234 RepID=A0ACC6IIU3_9ACTN|nr:hypothetical protein [Nocardioides zeae]MDR6174522.1 hypothetical protein [Nocardioides zeae]MDR6210594.1 hypothetical protein [Nocardioides zeae]